MIFFLLALVTAALGAVPAIVAGRRRLFFLLFAVVFLVSSFIYYLAMPSLDYTLGGAVAAAIAGVSFFGAIAVVQVTRKFSAPALIPSGIYVLAILFVLVSGCGALNTRKYSALIGDMNSQGKTIKLWTQQNQEISPTHLRIVPQEYALSIGKTALNQHADDKGNIVGSQFEVAEDYVTLQKVDNELYYVIPLDYRNWGTYNATAGVPGYVMVNAEDQRANPKFINGFAMRYTPGSFFGSNLERHLYENGYAGKVLTDYSFEVDDSLKPYWVVSVCHHTIGMYSGLVVDGVVIVDPCNGSFTYYPKATVPAWVDRVMPVDVIHDNLSWWGAYLNGYWNSTVIGASTNMRRPESTVLNYGSDGTCWYVTPLTSNNENDNTMTDLVYTNSRTGESHRYIVSGATEDALMNTVNATVKFQNLHAAAVVYENVAGRLSALVPILGDDHSIRGLALVDVLTKNLAWDPDPSNALIKYQNIVGSLGAAIGTDLSTTEKTFIGRLDRIHEGMNSTGSLYYLYFKGVTHIFTVPQTFHSVLITEPGDSISFTYQETDADLVSVTHFENLSVKMNLSKNQEQVLEKTEERRK